MSYKTDRFRHDPTRRLMLRGAVATLIFGVAPVAHAASSVVAVRVWPAKAYTRITLESDTPLKFNQFMVPDPDRLVVDLDGVDWNNELANIASRIGTDDPYVKQLRAGRFKPGTVRVVLDLKTEVKPQVFALQTYGDYKHRLVIDLYPARADDTLVGFSDDATKPDAKSDQIARADVAPKSDVAAPKTDATAKPDGTHADKTAHKDKDGDMVTREQLNMKRVVTIVIDPGHGGEDPGAIGKGGTYEKTVTLAIGKRLKGLLDKHPNVRAVLTRDDDYFVPLAERVVKARKVNADLFMSIHADAFVKPDARGSSVFALSEGGASSTAAKWLAQTQNDSDLIGGVRLDVKDPYLAHTLFDLTQTATINDSLKFGRAMLGSLSEVNRLHHGSVEQAGFAVLKAPDIPSILVETAFISNPEEEKKLIDEDYQDKMAQALMAGLQHYLSKNPPLARSTLA